MQMPAVSSIVPQGGLVQQPAVINPVLVNTRLPAVQPPAITPHSAVIGVPLISRALSAQHYTDQ